MADPPFSPAASTASATSTNPNTPRSSEPHEGNSQADEENVDTGNHQAVAIDAAPSSPSSLESPSPTKHDIQPTWPSKIIRTKIRAEACWLDRTIDNLLLDIHWVGEHSRAFLKLSTTLHLEGAPSASRHGLVNAYIFIYPERIRQLSFTSQPQYSPFGPPTIALTFDLGRPPALILPKTYTSFGPGAEDMMLSLRSLNQQTYFTVFASLPSRVLSSSWLQQFCQDITEHKLTTIASLANLKSLYQGHGAQVVEGDGPFEAVCDQGNAAAPELPAYEEANPSFPPSGSTKRKRSYDESSAMGHDSKSTGIAAMQALIGDMLEAKLTAHERRVGAMLSAHEDKVQEMLSAHLCKVNEQLAINNYSIADQIDAVEERVRNDVVSEFTDTINNRILEEMEGVQESVMEQITSMPLQAHLTFPNHPYL
ncbi:hypothetical protein ACHAPV_001421 [Trichoderma viride]